jgi:hypothetical protein
MTKDGLRVYTPPPQSVYKLILKSVRGEFIFIETRKWAYWRKSAGF